MTMFKWLTIWRISTTSSYFGFQSSVWCQLFIERMKYFKKMDVDWEKVETSQRDSLIPLYKEEDTTELLDDDNSNDCCLYQISLVLWESILFIRFHFVIGSLGNGGISMGLIKPSEGLNCLIMPIWKMTEMEPQQSLTNVHFMEVSWKPT